MKRLKLNIFLILATSIFTLYLSAQPAERLVKVLIAPNHENWQYKIGEPIKYNISIIKNSVTLRDVEVRYEISEDMMTPHKVKTQVLKDGTLKIDGGTMTKAGFLRCQVFCKYMGNEYVGLTTVAFEPEKIQPTTKQPEDFIQFWKSAKESAAKVPMDIKMILMPDKCTEKVNVYNVSIQSYQFKNRLYGVLCVPKKEGKYPAILTLPGAGVRSYNGYVEGAEKGFITFQIGIHGIPVNMDSEIYEVLANGALKGYPTFNMENRDQYYYKRVYLSCIRAVDYIFSLAEFDGKNCIARGGSQGGALSIITAALDNRITGLVAYHPALCDMTGYVGHRAGGWPHVFKDSLNRNPEKIQTSYYYDVVNFARQIKVPGFYSFGFNDMVCPPTSVYSAINVINAPKGILIIEETGHYTFPEQSKNEWEWINKLFTHS